MFPAMGSHGGATAQGHNGPYLKVMALPRSYIGAPIRATMDVVARASYGVMERPIYVDRYASEADGIVLVNRIKPHTYLSRHDRKRDCKDDDHRHGEDRRRIASMHSDKGMDLFGTVLPEAALRLNAPYSLLIWPRAS